MQNIEVKKAWHQDPSKWVNKHEHFSSMSSANARVEFLKTFPDDICQSRCWKSNYTPDRPWQVTYLCRIGIEPPQQFGERVAAEIRSTKPTEKLSLRELTGEVQTRKRNKKNHYVKKLALPDNWKEPPTRGPTASKSTNTSSHGITLPKLRTKPINKQGE